MYNGVLLSHEKNETFPFATWIDLEDLILSETSQTEEDKYFMISLIYVYTSLSPIPLLPLPFPLPIGND